MATAARSQPRYPVYIISKGRADTRLTAKALERMQTPYRIVVEPQEREAYEAVIDPEKVLVLPFSNLGQGSIPARNWVWEHAASTGAERYWLLDDNIRHFYRYHRNEKYRVGDGTCFRVCEDLTDRYVNVALSGLQSAMFIRARQRYRPLQINTRVSCCMLILTGLEHRWRGRYAESSDLTMRALRDGWCTLLVQAFLADKMPSLDVRGGNNGLYAADPARLTMAQELFRQHGPVVQLTDRRMGWKHHFDYRPYRRNRLILRPGVTVTAEADDYGLALTRTS